MEQVKSFEGLTSTCLGKDVVPFPHRPWLTTRMLAILFQWLTDVMFDLRLTRATPVEILIRSYHSILKCLKDPSFIMTVPDLQLTAINCLALHCKWFTRERWAMQYPDLRSWNAYQHMARFPTSIIVGLCDGTYTEQEVGKNQWDVFGHFRCDLESSVPPDVHWMLRDYRQHPAIRHLFLSLKDGRSIHSLKGDSVEELSVVSRLLLPLREQCQLVQHRTQLYRLKCLSRLPDMIRTFRRLYP